MADTEVIAYHGWGFDARCWDNLRGYVGDEITWKCFNRGYFNAPNAPAFSEGADRKILCTHSFGLHFCTPDMLQEADVLIIFSGFLSFHPHAAQFRRRSKQVVQLMLEHLKENPEELLKTFYQNVYHPQPVGAEPGTTVDTLLLVEDLEKLNTTTIDESVMFEELDICILHGAEDAIVRREKGREMYATFGDGARYFELNNAGHALPFSHAETCYGFLNPILNDG